uniref:AAA+ ATPase domain-containing protein n=1 Tax=Ditylenchus dipsaci TaxID=166011 RepID=A0A915E7Y1_9BILA
MDIRKFFSASGPSDEKSEKQNFTANQPVSRSMKGSGLSKERQLNLSPSPKQTKKSNLRANVSNVVISSEEDTDGECPISDQLKKEVRKNRKTKIISSDEEDAITSANALRQPVSSADENITRCSPRKKKPFSHEALSPVLLSDAPAPSKGKDVARRNPRKLITDMEPIHGVVTNKKRKRNCKDAKDAQKDEVNEVVPKRSKLAGSKQVDCDEMPMGVFANEEKGTVKTKKSDRSNTKLNIPAVSNLNKKRSSEKLIDIDARSNTRTSSSSPKKSKTKLQKTVVTANIPEDMTIKGTMHLMASRPTQNSDQEALKKQLDLPWVDKYKPIQQKELVGQHTDKSPFNKLVSWLRDWPKYNLGVRALQKKSRPNQYQAQSDGTSFKAALLSGPPGIGKTTCGVFACKQLNLQYLELNASDSRGKKAIESQVSSLLEDNRMDKYYFSSAGKVTSKVLGINQVLIMDEVDGMSGNQDRSGIMELIQMIKRTKVPIICICNDRQSQKIRSLANYCFDLRFTRPRAEQIKGRLQTIAYKENLKIPSETLDKIIEASNQDLRQCIHSLQLMNSGSSKADQRFQKKDISVNIFEAARTCLSSDSTLAENRKCSFLTTP